MRVVFMGTPEFALPTLRRLIGTGHEIVGVFTQPDRPTGRNRKLAPPPVKLLALEHGLPVYQPASISKLEVVEQLRQLAPDVGVIAAYGQILRQPVLDAPRLGLLNVHASLLPRWRGAAPIPAAILAGDERTGATIMQVRLALDAGPMLARVDVPIGDDDTTSTLTSRIAEAGAVLLIDVLPRYTAGEIAPQDQDDALVTYAPQIKKTDALIDWDRDDAMGVWRKVRAYNPWPVAYSYLDGQPLRMLECIPLDLAADGHAPGTIIALPAESGAAARGAGFGIVAAGGVGGVVRVQGTGGKAMPAVEYLRGHRAILGMRMRAKA